ncbi:ATP-grasp domain-containing protein [Pigmentibacter ruber]|uniref:ATP-grasp domain-containing protein n=1 Tax=Pigmentibacter ruber TaxID=2683196 RepID=UPI00131CC812|nr:ATP-grasp domain-containing protein [Pigmentibacter ruber]BFD31136.1 ATP-grasp domain-containing protein [Pigmentibacter ruber]
MEKYNSQSQDIICIVDAYSTGKKLAYEFNKYGKKCIHIKSTSREEEELKRNEFIEELTYTGNLFSLKDELKKFNPEFIIAGSEMGVELADKLSEIFNIQKCNNPLSTTLRRNKYFMHEKLKEWNLKAIKQFKSKNVLEIMNWAEINKKWPVVVKPLNSAASDGVTICANTNEIEQAFSRIMYQENKLGIKNEEVLIQEYIEGTQYFVNTVSWNGKHYISDIWKQNRRRLKDRAFLFESMSLCDSDGKIEIELIEYTKKVLDALELSHGAAHNEIMFTKDGPILIELNARLMGASIEDEAFKQALDKTQSELLALVYSNHDLFMQEFADKKYSKKQHLNEVSFIYEKNGILLDFPKKYSIERMFSFFCFSGLNQIGNAVKKTEDTLGHPGYVYLVHHDEEIISKDTEQILKWQRNNELFIIE